MERRRLIRFNTTQRGSLLCSTKSGGSSLLRRQKKRIGFRRRSARKELSPQNGRSRRREGPARRRRTRGKGGESNAPPARHKAKVFSERSERGRRARNNDSLFAFSERGIGSDAFCVTVFHVVDKMMFSLATTPHKTVGNAFSCKGARHRRKQSFFKRAKVRSAAKADEDDTDPVQETFKKLYTPNSGKRIKYGVFQETVSASEKNTYTDEEKTRLRAKAAEELTVIDDEERKRRGWFWFWFSLQIRFVVVSLSFIRILRIRAFHRAVL